MQDAFDHLGAPECSNPQWRGSQADVACRTIRSCAMCESVHEVLDCKTSKEGEVWTVLQAWGIYMYVYLCISLSSCIYQCMSMLVIHVYIRLKLSFALGYMQFGN